MIGGLPDSTARRIGECIVQTVDVPALIAVLCVADAIVWLFSAKHSGSDRAKLLRRLAVLLGATVAGPLQVPIQANGS